jgi:predicted MPP superfamily phosphohydrolase
MTPGLLAFILAVIGTWSLMHYHVFLSLTAIGMDRGVLTPSLWALALVFPVTRLLAFRWSNLVFRILFWVGAIWMGAVFLLSFWFLVASAVRGLFRMAGAPGTADPAPWIAAAAAAVAGMVAWGIFHALRGPKEARFLIDRSARYGKGRQIRIVQISDVHLGLTLGVGFIRSVVERINGLAPDLVFITGDLFDPEFPGDAQASAALAGIRASQGTFAVTGNHEFYSGLDRFMAMMKAAGITVLENETRITDHGLQVSGIHDQTANRFADAGVACDIGKALRDIDGAKPSFLLAHQPKELGAAAAKRVDVVFSGHTHAGQIFPFRAVVRLAYRYLGGRHRLGPDTDLVVCTGTGFWGPPMRLGTDSQIVVVDFRY